MDVGKVSALFGQLFGAVRQQQRMEARRHAVLQAAATIRAGGRMTEEDAVAEAFRLLAEIESQTGGILESPEIADQFGALFAEVLKPAPLPPEFEALLYSEGRGGPGKA